MDFKIKEKDQKKENNVDESHVSINDSEIIHSIITNYISPVDYPVRDEQTEKSKRKK